MELHQDIIPAIGRVVGNSWKPKKFFSYLLFSFRYLSLAIFHAVRVCVPASIQGVIWLVETSVKLVILFFALIILLLGPRIGLPRAIYQVCPAFLNSQDHFYLFVTIPT